ncbi:MAG TPA: hypothetical protein PKB13_14110, partial [Clostridia bacterium]|nr:hypothetical protein [Clostridia bacterium]
EGYVQKALGFLLGNKAADGVLDFQHDDFSFSIVNFEEMGMGVYKIRLCSAAIKNSPPFGCRNKRTDELRSPQLVDCL